MRGPQSATPVLIVSAERPDLTPEVNAARTKALRQAASERGLAWTPCRGAWHGQQEASTIVDATGLAGREFRQFVLDTFQQDAVLAVTPQRIAVLYTKDGGRESLGPLHTSDRAPRSGNYTYVPSAKTFYYTGAR